MATVEQLKEMARDAEVDGFSGMNKAELIAALGFENEAEADAELAAQDQPTDGDVVVASDLPETERADRVGAEGTGDQIAVAAETGLIDLAAQQRAAQEARDAEDRLAVQQAATDAARADLFATSFPRVRSASATHRMKNGTFVIAIEG